MLISPKTAKPMDLYYCSLICFLIIKGANLKSVNHNATDAEILFNETGTQSSTFDTTEELARSTDEFVVVKNFNASYTITSKTNKGITLNTTVPLTQTLNIDEINTTDAMLIDSNSSFRLYSPVNEENNIKTTFAFIQTLFNTEESNVSEVMTTSRTIKETFEEIYTTETALIDSNSSFRLLSPVNEENNINTTIGLIPNNAEDTVPEVTSTSNTIEETFDSTSIAENEETVSEASIWTKKTTQRLPYDTELKSIDLYGDEDSEETGIITNYDDLMQCWQLNNKSGVCIETRKCMKQQPMQTRFNSCEWPKDRDAPTSVCCDLYDSEDTDKDSSDDNIYWSDATVNCGVPRMSATYAAQRSQYLNLSDQYYMRRNKRQTNGSSNFKSLNRSLRIVNGKNAELGKIPWIVSLYHVSEGFLGGGVIISRRHFITAAHCLNEDSNWLKYFIRVGSLNTYLGKKYRITRCVLHRQYDKSIQITNDIAICRLHTDIEFTAHVSPICLPQRGMIGRYLVGRPVHVSGYGTTNSADSDVLKESQVTVISNGQCYRSYSTIRTIRVHAPHGFRDTIMCAGEGERDACDGDSGGPLAFFHKDRWHLVGIVGFGWKCGRPEYPGVYTCVAPYLRWLKRYLH